jgi:multicomponent Na+:H+ antiporter subunit D
MTSNLPILLFMIPFLAALVAAIAGWLWGGARWIALGALLVTAALSVAAVPQVLAAGALRTHMGGWPPPFGIEVVLDPLSAFVSAVVALVALVIMAGTGSHVDGELPAMRTVYYSSTLILVSGLMGIVGTGDLFNLFVHVEMASLAAYALVAAGGRGAPRAALNYLVIGTLGASLYLMGVGFIYAGTGTLNMADAARLMPAAEPRLVLVGGLLILGGLGVKMALFPLHMWMPAAYAYAPAAAATLMAPLVTKVSAYALIRLVFWVFGGVPAITDELFLELLAWAGAGAMVAGGLLALTQRDLRRLLAYSSVGQMGIVALGAGLATSAGMTGAVLHIANDALMKAVLFLAAGIALLRFGVRDVGDLARLRGHAPWTAAAMAVAGVSLIGIPPFAGFFGKWYVLTATLTEERWLFTAALVVSSLVTVGYVLRILEQLYFARPAAAAAAAAGGTVAAAGGPALREGPFPAVAAVVLLGLAIVVLGLGNGWVVTHLVRPALPALLQ